MKKKIILKMKVLKSKIIIRQMSLRAQLELFDDN